MELTNYETLVEHARNFYQNAAIRQECDAERNLDKFFDEAFREIPDKPAQKAKIYNLSGQVVDNGGEVTKKFNPSVVRMALQQGQCDILAGCMIARDSGQINENAFKELQQNIIKATQRVYRSIPGLQSFCDMKTTFPKTYLKRIAIAQCLRDGALIELENQNEGRIAETTKVFGEDLGLANVNDLKGAKKVQLGVLKVSSFIDKIIFAPVKVFKKIKNIKKLFVR